MQRSQNRVYLHRQCSQTISTQLAHNIFHIRLRGKYYADSCLGKVNYSRKVIFPRIRRSEKLVLFNIYFQSSKTVDPRQQYNRIKNCNKQRGHRVAKTIAFFFQCLIVKSLLRTGNNNNNNKPDTVGIQIQRVASV